MQIRASFRWKNKDGLKTVERRLGRAETEIPEVTSRAYMKNVAPLTPAKTFRLRRSVVRMKQPKGILITWRAPYMMAQNVGHHNQLRSVTGPNRRDGGFGTIKGGTGYIYRQYTTPGTGPRFAQRAMEKTKRELPAIYRQLGLFD